MKRFFLIFLITFVYAFSVSSQLCRRNVIDCTGQCGRFNDKDNDGFCDFSPRSKDSEPVNKEPEVAEPVTVVPVEPVKNSPVSETTKSLSTEKNISAGSKKVGLPVAAIPTEKPVNVEKTDTVLKATPNVPVVLTSLEKELPTATKPIEEVPEKPYALLEIIALTLFFYFLSVLLVKTNSIKKATHRKLWNVILLLTFLMSGILGLFLVVQLNYGFVMSWYMDFLKLHVEFGIAMAIISIIHIIWHTSYYLNMIRKKKTVSPVHPIK